MRDGGVSKGRMIGDGFQAATFKTGKGISNEKNKKQEEKAAH